MPLFADLNKREIKRIASLFKERRFCRRRDGHSGGLGRGRLLRDRLRRGDGLRSTARSKAVLKPGDHFGEIALIDEGTRTATVTASTELVCYGSNTVL